MVFNFKNFFLSFICFILFFLKSTFAETKLFMLTDKSCGVCIVWEKQIGNIYNKTDVSNIFPIERLYVDKIDKKKLNSIFKTNATPTFVFYKNNIEIGRISGYSNPEMFWWQIDEIIEN